MQGFKGLLPKDPFTFFTSRTPQLILIITYQNIDIWQSASLKNLINLVCELICMNKKLLISVKEIPNSSFSPMGQQRYGSQLDAPTCKRKGKSNSIHQVLTRSYSAHILILIYSYAACHIPHGVDSFFINIVVFLYIFQLFFPFSRMTDIYQCYYVKYNGLYSHATFIRYN